MNKKTTCLYYLQESDNLDLEGKIDGICLNPFIDKRYVNHFCKCEFKEIKADSFKI